jgi:16S rRNA (cytosine967-C5)-methyltransferase
MNHARIVAWELVRSGDALPTRAVDAAAREHELDARDRGFVRRLVDLEARRRGTLRVILSRVVTRKPSADLTAHLHLGLVQAFFLDRIPDHALVSETVGAVRHTMGDGPARFANAVLRSALRLRKEGVRGDPRCDLPLRPWHLAQPLFHDPAEHPLLWAEDALSLPAAVFKHWDKRFGRERAIALAIQALDEPQLSLRAVRGDARALVAELGELGVGARVGTHPKIALVDYAHAEAALHSKAITEGRATVQGESALRAAEAVDAKPGERVLDLCAAPGGKTAVLAEAGAHVVACDIGAEKLQRLAGTLQRLGLTDRVELVDVGDPSGLAKRSFDAVLIDAPCSNTGVLARRPEARWRYAPAFKASLLRLQQQLVDRALPLVRPGGRLVWSTCSLDADENARRAAAIVAADPDFSVELDHESLPAPVGVIGPVDGGYFARLARRG